MHIIFLKCNKVTNPFLCVFYCAAVWNPLHSCANGFKRDLRADGTHITYTHLLKYVCMFHAPLSSISLTLCSTEQTYSTSIPAACWPEVYTLTLKKRPCLFLPFQNTVLDLDLIILNGFSHAIFEPVWNQSSIESKQEMMKFNFYNCTTPWHYKAQHKKKIVPMNPQVTRRLKIDTTYIRGTPLFPSTRVWWLCLSF